LRPGRRDDLWVLLSVDYGVAVALGDHDTEGSGELPEFEEIYARAGGDFAAAPWVMLAAHPMLVDWLNEQSSGVWPIGAGRRMWPGR